jgi:beta-lactamase class A
MNRWVCSLAVTSLCALRALGGEPSFLEDRIAPIAREHKGKIAVAVKGLRTGEDYYLHADEPMPTASLIKLAVMVEAYWQAEEGKVSLDKTLTLKKDDKVPGSGILTNHFSDGATFPLRDAVRMMIVFSDNTATNMVLDQTGIRPVNERMEKLGLKETKINAKVFKGKTTNVDKERFEKYGLGSTTARESVRLLEMILRNEVVSEAACGKMLDHLKACEDKDKIVRSLPPGTAVAHKSGSLTDAKTDVGIVYLRDPTDKKEKPLFLICVMTNDNEDKRWVADNAAQVTIGKIARAAYDHFTTDKK